MFFGFTKGVELFTEVFISVDALRIKENSVTLIFFILKAPKDINTMHVTCWAGYREYNNINMKYNINCYSYK